MFNPWNERLGSIATLLVVLVAFAGVCVERDIYFHTSAMVGGVAAVALIVVAVLILLTDRNREPR
ncbi:MAG: hypothetical protein ABI743_08995 [bacterium]